jgi:hypothetical protein
MWGMEWEVQHHTFLTLVQDAGKWSAACSGHFTPGTKSVCVHLVAHLFVIRNHYYDFYFAVLFKVQTQRLRYSCVAWPIFALLKPVPVFRFLATVAAVCLDPSGANSFVVLRGRHHTFHFLSILKSL